MGFWKKLFGLEKKSKAEFKLFAVDKDGDGKVQDGTIWERPADLSVNLDKTLEKAEQLLKEVTPAAKPKSKKAATTKKPASTAKTKSAPKKADPKKAKPKATTSKKKK